MYIKGNRPTVLQYNTPKATINATTDLQLSEHYYFLEQKFSLK